MPPDERAALCHARSALLLCRVGIRYGRERHARAAAQCFMRGYIFARLCAPRDDAYVMFTRQNFACCRRYAMPRAAPARHAPFDVIGCHATRSRHIILPRQVRELHAMPPC